MPAAKRRVKKHGQQVEVLKKQVEALKKQMEVIQKELKIQQESSKRQIDISVQEHINAILPVMFNGINQFKERVTTDLINSCAKMIKTLFNAYITGRDNAKKAIKNME